MFLGFVTRAKSQDSGGACFVPFPVDGDLSKPRGLGLFDRLHILCWHFRQRRISYENITLYKYDIFYNHYLIDFDFDTTKNDRFDTAKYSLSLISRLHFLAILIVLALESRTFVTWTAGSWLGPAPFDYEAVQIVLPHLPIFAAAVQYAEQIINQKSSWY